MGILTRHSPFIRTRGRCRIVSGRDKKLICGTFEVRGDADKKLPGGTWSRGRGTPRVPRS